jgi:hypothetical protein
MEILFNGDSMKKPSFIRIDYLIGGLSVALVTLAAILKATSNILAITFSPSFGLNGNISPLR